MFCSNCGTKNDDSAFFCSECGNSLRSAAQNAAQDNVYAQPQVQEAVYQQPAAPAARNSFLSYSLPENPIIKLPFPSFILKFIKMGIWTFYFFAIFFSWVFAKASAWGYVSKETANLFQVVFDSNGVTNGIDGGGLLLVAGLLTLLVILGAITIQVLNMFLPKKLPIPQIVLCAAPAAMTFLFMIIAWIVMGIAVAEFKDWGASVSAGPGFGAWFVFLLSGLETAAFILFQKDKSESLFKA